MQIPSGIETSNTTNKVCILRKSLYGLKQSPKAGFNRMTRVVKVDRFTQCQLDHTIFFKHSLDEKTTLFIVIVDDIVITEDDHKQVERLKNFGKRIWVKDLGQLKYFLGMEIARTKDDIYMSRRKYTLDLLQKIRILECKATNTPMESAKQNIVEVDNFPTDTTRYQSLVGKLIYLTHTRPDIGFVASMASRHMFNPLDTNMQAVRMIFQYLKCTLGRGLYFKKNHNMGIEMYIDSN